MEFTAERRQALLEEMRELLHDYDYETTDKALGKILDDWFNKKKGLIEILSKHPNWNPDKWHIAFDQDFERNVDSYVIGDVGYGFYSLFENNVKREELVIEGMTRREVERKYNLAYYAARLFHSSDIDVETSVISGYKSYQEAREAKNRFERLYGSFEGRTYTQESEAAYRKANRLIEQMRYYYFETVNSDLARWFNDCHPDLRVKEGQKTSRAFNKALKSIGADEWVDNEGNKPYNRLFAKYSDAINTLQVVRHTVISVNPIDYLTMSFGNSWSSCHTIDKRNKRNRGGDGYQGCYSSGTMSYMLDGVSMVFYTVDSKYDGVDYELQDKINRNMFHFGQEKLIQGRVYPQANDGDNGLYEKIRVIMQKVIADCLEVPNMWTVEKGTSAASRYVCSEGTHYTDYTHYSSCNLSRLIGSENDCSITIGALPIDVKYGRKHNCDCHIQPCDNEDDWDWCDDYGSRYDDDDESYDDDDYWSE